VKSISVLLALTFGCSLFSGGCYSFSGASVPPHLKTIAIPLVDDQSGFGQPNLREEVTAALTREFIDDNTLEIAERRLADSILEGAIVSVLDVPLVLAQGEQGEKVGLQRVTVAVKMTYEDLKLKKTVWEKTFTNTGEYDPAGGFSAREDALKEAIRKITEDVLLDTVSGW